MEELHPSDPILVGLAVPPVPIYVVDVAEEPEELVEVIPLVTTETVVEVQEAVHGTVKEPEVREVVEVVI
jgi:hypothetical protein